MAACYGTALHEPVPYPQTVRMRTCKLSRYAPAKNRHGTPLSKRGPSWAGRMMLGVGWALLDARIGENRAHSHVAHQVTLALESRITVLGTQPTDVFPPDAVLVPAGVVHSIAPAGVVVRTLYVDPLFAGLSAFAHSQGLIRLKRRQAKALSLVRSGEDVGRWVKCFLRHSPDRVPDPRLHSVLASVEPGTSPTALAQALGLSTTRLREIAIRDFGVPTAKLLQWLQLQHAVDAFRQTHNLADAAASGGFSDQAHFTRRLVEWFGVTPSLGLAQLEISVIR